MSDAGFGKPKYGSGASGGSAGFSFKRFKLETPKRGGEPTEGTYRIMPPFKSLAASGQWIKYHAEHYGYKGMNRDGTKAVARPFACVEEKDRRTKAVTVRCPKCDEIAQKKQERDLIEAQAKASGKSPDELEAILEPYDTWLRDHNVEKKYHLLAMNEAGEFGVLKIGYNHKLALEEECNQLLDRFKLDPLDLDSGVQFVFVRQYKDGKLHDTVRVKKIVQSDMSERIVLAPLSEEQQKTAAATLPDLNDVVTKITADQIRRLVSSGGDLQVVDSIFGMPQPAKPRINQPTEINRDQPNAMAPELVVPPKPVDAPSPAVSNEELAIQAQIAEMSRKLEQMKAAQSQPSLSPSPPKSAARNMSKEEFDRLFEKTIEEDSQ